MRLFSFQRCYLGNIHHLPKTMKMYSVHLTKNVRDKNVTVIEPNRNQKKTNLRHINPFTANPTKWSSTLKQFVSFCRLLSTNCLTVFDYFVDLTNKGLSTL